MTCKTLEADSGVFSLGSTSPLPPLFSGRKTDKWYSGRGTSD